MLPCEISHLHDTLSFETHKIPFRHLLVHYILRRKAWMSPYLDTWLLELLEVAKT
jgi:hypothetical protein